MCSLRLVVLLLVVLWLLLRRVSVSLVAGLLRCGCFCGCSTGLRGAVVLRVGDRGVGLGLPTCVC